MRFVFLFLTSLYITGSSTSLEELEALGSFTSLGLTQIHSFLWLSNISKYVCTTTSLFIHLLMDIKVASMSWLLQTVLQ